MTILPTCAEAQYSGAPTVCRMVNRDSLAGRNSAEEPSYPAVAPRQSTAGNGGIWGSLVGLKKPQDGMEGAPTTPRPRQPVTTLGRLLGPV